MHRPAADKKYHLKSLMRLFGPFSNYIWRCLNVIKICAGWTGWAQISVPKMAGETCEFSVSAQELTGTITSTLSVEHLRSGSVKTSLVGKKIKALIPCKNMKMRAEQRTTRRGKTTTKKEAMMVGGNGCGSLGSVWVSVCGPCQEKQG